MNSSLNSTYKIDIIVSAKEYVGLGWYVFPLHSVDENLKCTCGNPTCSDAGKHPRLARGLKEASRDLAKIDVWFGEGSPPSNIGIVTGEISGITVIDIDIGEGKFGAESWAEAIKDHGEPQTLMAQTGSGGMHVLFKYNSALKTSSNTLGKGIDCRNDGGYIVATPSAHRSGGFYKWLNWGDELATLPAHLSRRKETRGRPKRDDMYRGKYTVEQVASMLEVVPADDRDLWRSVGVILGREFKRVDEAWQLYVEWAGKDSGKKTRNHDEIMHEAFYDISQQQGEKELTIGTIVKAALDNGWAPNKGEVPIGNFVYYGPGNNFIYRPTVSYWIGAAVDSAVSPVNENGNISKATDWLKLNQLITSLTKYPQIEEDILKGYDNRDGELIKIAGAATFNTYKPARIELGDAKLAKPYLDHVYKVFNKEGDAEQFLSYMAHRVQKPWEKPRFAILIAGGQGVGKDTAVEMCCPAIGEWNVANIDPSAFESTFNEFAAYTLVRVSEAANLQDMSKWVFNERTKVLISGSPDICTINPKFGHKFSVRMFCGVIITTNHLASGIYIPTDDRRYDVIEAANMGEMDLKDEIVRREYFSELWDWFLKGGASHIAAYLSEKNIDQFSASNGQRKTKAHKEVIQSELEQHGWLLDILEQANNPRFISVPMIKHAARINEGHEFIKDTKFNMKLNHAVRNAGYFNYRNPLAGDGRWYKSGHKKGFIVYAKIGTPAGLDPKSEVKAEEELF